MANKRLGDFDFIKGCLIIFVIWGHFCMYLSGNDYEKNILTTYIRLFQMPLFIFISGYFQKPLKTIDNFRLKIKKSISHIGIPFIAWIFIAYGIKLIYHFKEYNGISYFVEQAHGVVSLLWYLGCLLICLIVYAIIDFCYNHNKFIGLSLLFVSILIPLVIKTDLLHVGFLWIFFLLGSFFRKSEDKINYCRLCKTLKTLLFVVLVISVLYVGRDWQTQWTFYNATNCVALNVVGWNSKIIFVLLRYMLYISATYCAFKVMKLIYMRHLKSRLILYVENIGKETLFFVCISYYNMLHHIRCYN